jgi:Fe2+ transport system protein FeoA
MAMGLLPGTTIFLQHTAPFGGAYYIKTTNHYVALRSQEAENILLTTNE